MSGVPPRLIETTLLFTPLVNLGAFSSSEPVSHSSSLGLVLCYRNLMVEEFFQTYSTNNRQMFFLVVPSQTKFGL